jgi:hypothetical protein
MKTKTNPNQLHFDFAPTRPDYLVQAPFGPARLPGENLGDYILRYIAPAPAPVAEPVEAVAGTNATFEVAPGSFRRVIIHGEVREGHRLYRRIQFPGATYSTGEPRIQTVNGGVVTPDPF